MTATSISAGQGFALAIGSDGHLYAWGGESAGLGNGTTSSTTPVEVSLPTGSVPDALGPEPGALSSYAIVTATDVAPTVTSQPADQAVFAGQDATFTAAASGFPSPSTQWQVSTDGGVSFSTVPGATTDTLTVSSATLAQNGNEYRAVFTNGVGTATSDPAVLDVSSGTAPVITTDLPASGSAASGSTLTFTVGASGNPTPTLDWQLSADSGSEWISLGPLTGDSITSGPLSAFENGWQVRAVFTNGAGTATTTAETITVVPGTAPVITTDLPASGSAASGSTLTFTVGASGNPTPTLDWQLSADSGSEWISLGPLTGDSITSGPLSAFENGWQVRAVFTNGAGTATTTAETINVT